MKIHHIGYLVKKIDRAISTFNELGYVLEGEITKDDYRKAQICFLEKDGYRIELVSPVSKESVVYNLMKKTSNSPYHICYETDEIDKEIQCLQEQRYVMCSEKHVAPALDGRNVCFLVHPYIGMIELLEG